MILYLTSICEANHHLATDAGLSHGLAPLHHGVEGIVRGLRYPHHLQQLHHRHGVEKVQPAEAVPPVRGGDGDVADGQRGGVGGEDGLGRRNLVVLGKYFLLEVDVLYHGLHYEVGGLQGIVGFRGYLQPGRELK